MITFIFGYGYRVPIFQDVYRNLYFPSAKHESLLFLLPLPALEASNRFQFYQINNEKQYFILEGYSEKCVLMKYSL